MKKYIQYVLMICGMIALLASCELFGLDYQYDYENDKADPIKLYLDVNCYEFIQERSNSTMALMYEAINRAGMKDFYEAEDRTFLLLEDTEFAKWIDQNRCTSLEDIPVATLQDFLRSYTIKGLYSAYELTTSAIDLETFKENGKTIRIGLIPKAAGSSQDITGIRMCWTPEFGATESWTTCYTTNLRPTNGVAHLLKDLLKVGVVK